MILKISKTEQESKISLQNIEKTQEKVLSTLKNQNSISIYAGNTTLAFAIIILTICIIIFPIIDFINYIQLRKVNKTARVETENSQCLSDAEINETSFIDSTEKIKNFKTRKIKKVKSRIWRY
jgi:hypothetical protein